MTYKILSQQARSVFESYNNKTRWCCFSLPDSDKTQFLLSLMSAIDNDKTPYADHINESILLVGLTAFKNYLQEQNNTQLSDNINTLIQQHASVKLGDEMKPFVNQAKTCIDNYGSVVLVGNFRYSDALLAVPSGEENSWPKNVAAMLNKGSFAPTLRN